MGWQKLYQWLGLESFSNFKVEFEERAELNALLEKLGKKLHTNYLSLHRLGYENDATDLISFLSNFIFLDIAHSFCRGILNGEDWDDLNTIILQVYDNLRTRRSGRKFEFDEDFKELFDEDFKNRTEAAELKISAVIKVLDSRRYRISQKNLEDFLKVHTENPQIVRGREIQELGRFLSAFIVDIAEENKKVNGFFENKVRVRNEVKPNFVPLQEIALSYCKRPKILRNLAIDMYPEVVSKTDGVKVDRRTAQRAWKIVEAEGIPSVNKLWQPRSRKRQTNPPQNHGRKQRKSP